MTKKTHICAGIAATLPIISATYPISVLGLLGAIAPDWDIILGIKHRTTTHSLIALIISTIILSIFNIYIGLSWGLNYGIHLLLDSFTKMGVPLFYPFNQKYYGYKKIYTSGAEDLLLCILLLYLIASFVLQ